MEIKKIDIPQSTAIDASVLWGGINDNVLATKINEVIDVVNKLKTMAKNTNTILESLVQENNIHEKQIDELQMKVEPEKCETPANPYAEQRKWIGCVCRFWYDNPDDTVLDYLGKIQTGENGIEYYGKETYDWFPHCEPVKPDDDIIYKGGDNE